MCEACGAQLNILDHESRLADHYGGKMHLGMIEIREKFEEMRVISIYNDLFLRIAKKKYSEKY